MRQEILRKIDALIMDYSKKTLEYSDCMRRDAFLADKKKIRLELKEIERQIAALRELVNDEPVHKLPHD